MTDHLSAPWDLPHEWCDACRQPVSHCDCVPDDAALPTPETVAHALVLVTDPLRQRFVLQLGTTVGLLSADEAAQLAEQIVSALHDWAQEVKS